jgi:hypothetical protein
MSGAIPPLPNTPSWPGAQLKKAQAQLYVYLHIIFKGMVLIDREFFAITTTTAAFLFLLNMMSYLSG